MINSQPKTSFLGVVFDVDHDFEGPRAPKAHLDTVNRNLSHHLAPPRSPPAYPGEAQVAGGAVLVRGRKRADGASTEGAGVDTKEDAEGSADNGDRETQEGHEGER